MRLLTVSAGVLHTIQIGGEVVKTGHLKVPQEEPWIITDDGVAGDRRAVHPDKLYAFSRASYTHWGAELGVEPSRWPDGFFGENLTLDTLDEQALRIGDVFTLGAEVRLFVAGARNPCLKLSWRLGQPPAFQERFARSGHAGAYFGVETTGRVRPGDRLQRVAHDPGMPSVADVSRYLIDRDPPPLEPLRKLLASPRLSGSNRLLLSAKVEAAERAQDAREGRWPGWRPFRVQAVVTEAPEILSVILRPSDEGALPRVKPGQHVQVELDDGELTVRRTWSLSAFDLDPMHYRITVRRQEGRGSKKLHELVPGDEVKLRAPAGDFTLDMGSYRPLVLIAAGIGITPLKAMLDAQLSRSSGSPVHLIYAGRTPEALAFRDELEALAAARDDLLLSFVYSRTEVPDAIFGRITPELVIGELQDIGVVVEGHRHTLPWFEAAIYMCGPDELCTALRAGLIARGGNASNIFHESFGAVVLRSELTEARVRFSASDRESHWTAAEDLTILELAEQAGLDIANSCRSGTCLTCRSRITGGATTADLGDGTCLPCIARPQTAEIELEI